MKWYVIKRDNRFIMILADVDDPLHGYRSWTLYAGPFKLMDKAIEVYQAALDNK